MERRGDGGGGVRLARAVNVVSNLVAPHSPSARMLVPMHLCINH